MHNNKPQSRRRLLSRGNLFVVTLAVVVGIIATCVTWCGVKHSDIGISAEPAVRLSATQVEAIRQIGQWELLTVDDEELIDTTRHGLFGDDTLSRIYVGTPRLGIDMSQLEADWLREEGDSMVAVLPAVTLLDERFVDEARSRAFYETGKWTEADRKALLTRATARMRKRCVSAQNLHTATLQAEQQMRQMLAALGLERVHVVVGK